MAGSLTTHVLDTAHGRGASAMRVALRRLAPDPALLAEATLDAGGRAALLEAGALTLGLYELLFEVGAYFGATSGFLDQVPVRFRVTDPGSHYHIPLIVSPFGYSTYRGG